MSASKVGAARWTWQEADSDANDLFPHADDLFPPLTPDERERMTAGGFAYYAGMRAASRLESGCGPHEVEARFEVERQPIDAPIDPKRQAEAVDQSLADEEPDPGWRKAAENALALLHRTTARQAAAKRAESFAFLTALRAAGRRAGPRAPRRQRASTGKSGGSLDPPLPDRDDPSPVGAAA